jgi:hypothetical protein
MLELSSALAARRTSLRLLARLDGLASVTKRAFDSLIYVGVATIVSRQITPDTWLAAWGLVAIRVIAILYVSRVIVELCVVLLREVLLGDGKITDATALQQRQTLIPVATSLLRYVVYIVSIAMVLGELGLDTTPLLAAAGLLGIAVGLGAQAIVSDLVSGFFILFEGLYFVGHRVQIGDAIGFVEEIGVRVSRIRDGAGAVHCIPNGEIRSVISFSQQFANAVVEFGVPYEEDLPRVFAAVQSPLRRRPRPHDDIVSDTQIVVEQLRESCVWLKAVTRVRPGPTTRCPRSSAPRSPRFSATPASRRRILAASRLSGATRRLPHKSRHDRRDSQLDALDPPSFCTLSTLGDGES